MMFLSDSIFMPNVLTCQLTLPGKCPTIGNTIMRHSIKKKPRLSLYITSKVHERFIAGICVTERDTFIKYLIYSHGTIVEGTLIRSRGAALPSTYPDV